MADTKLTGLTDNSIPGPADLVYVVADPGVTHVSSKATLLDLVVGGQPAALDTNEIKGWPPIVNTGDLDALNLWFDKVGTPSTAPSVVAVSGEAGVTEVFELALKVVTDASGEGLSQRFTYADEHRIKSGKRLSTLWAIWCVGGVGATLSIVNSSAEETAAAKVTSAAWSVVEVPNHLLAGTYCDIKIVADGAGTFYAVPLGANIGARGAPLAPRPLRYVDPSPAWVISNFDPGGADYTDMDFTAATSPLTAAVNLMLYYLNSTAAQKNLYIRRNGDATAGAAPGLTPQVNVQLRAYVKHCCCDDGQVMEYKTDGVAGDNESVYIGLIGYWEWD